MADATNAPVQQPDPGAPVPEPKSRPGFMATTTGKVVVAVVALLVLLGLAGVIVAMVAFGGVSGWLKSGGVSVAPTTKTSTIATTTTATAVPVVQPSEKPLTASFTFRNVFAPSIKPPVPATLESNSTSSTAGSTNSPDTLYLTDIVSTDDGRQGVFIWNGSTYTVGKGGVIGDSPWKVLEVGTDSVLMLYGDTQVTLTLGQGLSK